MATDIAGLALAVDTSDLEKGTASLTKFSTTAKGAQSGLTQMGTQMMAASKIFAQAIAGMNKGIYSLVTSTTGVSSSTKEAAASALAYSNSVLKEIKNVDQLIASQNQLTTAVERTTKAKVKSNSIVADSTVATNISKSKGTVNIGDVTRDTTTNRFNTANIAAQFQDVGVTAAMGMSPMTIALQQGTQLAAVLNTMKNPLQGIALAFQSILNPISLLTIGFVALGAILIQITDWTKVWDGAVSLMVSGVDFLIDNVDLLIIGLTTLTGVMVANSLAGFITAMNAAGLSMFGLLGATLKLTVATGIQAFTNVKLGVSSVVVGKAIKNQTIAMKGLTGTMVVATGVGKTLGVVLGGAWALLTAPITLAVLAVGGLITAVYKLQDSIQDALGAELFEGVKGVVNGIIGIFTLQFRIIYESAVFFKNNMVGVFQSLGNSIYKVLTAPLQLVIPVIDALFEKLSKIPGVNIDTTKLDAVIDKLKNPLGEVSFEGENPLTLAFDKAFNTDYLKVASDGIGVASDYVGEKLTGLKNTISSSGSDIEKEKDKWVEIVNSFNENLGSMQLETSLIGASTFEITRQTEAQRLLNEAKREGITITPALTEEIANMSVELANATVKQERLTEQFEFSKSTTQSFFQTMKDDLASGASMWEAFGNAVTNVLNSITDKMLEIGVDLLFQGLSGAGMFGGGGMSMIPTTSTGQINYGYDPGVLLNAKGNAFTNGVYSDPTLFKFANGGSFGVMGEAGPEAVMPLHRGPDGSLGVKADGGMGGSNVTVNVINNSNAQATVQETETSNGLQLDVMIDNMVSEKVMQQGSATNQSITNLNNRRLVQR